MIIEVPQPGLGIAAIAEIVTKGTPVLEERSSTVSPPEISTLKDFVTKSVHVLEAPTEAAPGSTPICNATKQRPNLIMHFMRHAEVSFISFSPPHSPLSSTLHTSDKLVRHTTNPLHRRPCYPAFNVSPSRPHQARLLIRI